MLSDEEILSTLNKRIGQCRLINERWRNSEVNENYALMEGEIQQWAGQDLQRQEKNGMPFISINKITPIINAIVGFEIQNRTKASYNAWIQNEQQLKFNEILNDIADWMDQESNGKYADSLALKDIFTCGMGVTDTKIDYTDNPNGQVKEERIFPPFVFWDPTARAKNLLDANFVIRMVFLDDDQLRETYGEDVSSQNITSASDPWIMQYFQTTLIGANINILYEYQWRDKKNFWRVENPLREILPITPVELIPNVLQYFMELGQIFGFNPETDAEFTVEDQKKHKALKMQFEALGYPFKAVKQKKWVYYRALTSGNNVLSKGENYSQTGFSIKFMTGEFSELLQYFYGLVKQAKPAQRMLNQAVSDYQGFLQTIPKGGVFVEEDAVKNMKGFIETYSKAKEVTVLRSGAISSGKMLPKQTPPIPAGLLEMIQYADQQIQQVCGVTPEFLGMMTSKQQTASLFRQQIRQSLLTLAVYFDAYSMYKKQKAMLYLDCARILIENNQSKIMGHITSEINIEAVPMFKDFIADVYDVEFDDIPSTPDQNQATFEKLVELQQVLAPNGINLAPLIAEYAPINNQSKEQLQALMQPPPPQEPDPLMQGLLAAEANLKNADAGKREADTMAVRVDTIKKIEDLQTYDEFKENELKKLKSEIYLNLSKTAENVLKSATL